MTTRRDPPRGFTRYGDLAAPVPPEGRPDFDPMDRRRRWLRQGKPRRGGRYVLYWMQMSKRARDNLALEEAIRRADALSLPVVVYEGLSHRYPGASRRVHRFVLEAARDTARTLERRGIRYVFQRRRGPNDSGDAVVRMAGDAALAVTDDFPTYVWPKLQDACEVDQSIRGSPRFPGGRRAGLGKLGAFVAHRLVRYAEDGRDPGAGIESDLSPYLHFGCLSARQVALAVLRAGDRHGAAVDAFLEQLIVRRELAYNFCRHTESDRHASLSELPEWARRTLADHADDRRSHLYDRETLESAKTHDEVWNAAQRELVHTGTIHGYLRMLWGKQLIRWTPDYDTAMEQMVDFHHRYALDGRNPNTYTNILWCFGLHDRAFGETEVLGKTRPMTSRSTRRKFDLAPYFRRVDNWERRARRRGEGTNR